MELSATGRFWVRGTAIAVRRNGQDVDSVPLHSGLRRRRREQQFHGSPSM